MPSRSIIRTGVGPHREPGNRFPAMAAINLLAARAARVQSRRNLSRSLSPKLDHSHSITRFDRSRTGPKVRRERGAGRSGPGRLGIERPKDCNRPRRAALTCLLAMTAMAQERLPTILPGQYTAEQKKAAEDFPAARNVPVFGPFEPLMYSPEVMSQARARGDYLRYKSGIGTTLSELVIPVTAREWTQDYEWYVHAPIAAKVGMKPEIIEATRDGQRPTGTSATPSRKTGHPFRASPSSASRGRTRGCWNGRRRA